MEELEGLHINSKLKRVFLRKLGEENPLIAVQGPVTFKAILSNLYILWNSQFNKNEHPFPFEIKEGRYYIKKPWKFYFLTSIT